MVTAWALW